MRVLLLVFFACVQANAAFYYGLKAPEKLELKNAPSVYRNLYTYWRDQYEYTRLLVENAQLYKKPAIELPYFFNFKGEAKVFDPPNQTDPYLGIVVGSPKLNRSSLDWLGAMIFSDAKYIQEMPAKPIVESARFLAVQAESKRESLGDFLVYSNGLSEEDMRYLKEFLKWDTYQAELEFKKIESDLSGRNISLNTFTNQYRALHYDWPNLGYEPNLEYKINYAVNFINLNTYYSYAALYADLDYLNGLKAEREADYDRRLKEAVRLNQLMSTLRSEIEELTKKKVISEKALARARDNEARSSEIIAERKVTLANLYGSWGHTGNAFARTKEEERAFKDRLDIDESFSMLDQKDFHSLNYWQRRKSALTDLKKNVSDFEKLCAILDKSSQVKCLEMPEYLTQHEDKFLAKLARAQYNAIEKSALELHWVNYEAVQKLYEHFIDPDLVFDRLLNWRSSDSGI